MSALRISVVNQHPAYAVGGSEVQTGFIAEGLASLGHQVQFVCPTDDGWLRQPPEELPYLLAPCRATSRDIVSTVLAASPDVVYWRYNRRAARASTTDIQAAGIPVVFASSSVDDLTRWRSRGRRNYQPRGLLALLQHRWNYAVLRRASALTVNNPAHLELAPRARYVPNAWQRQDLSFSWPRPYVAWVSNLKANKRPELFVRLAEELTDTEVDFLVAGRASAAYDWITDYRGDASLHYVGELAPTMVSRMLSSATLHVHTCGPEGFPNVFIQAWIHGTPSVSFEFDPAGLIEGEHLGGSAGGDWERFCTLVRLFLTDADALQAAGQRASSFAAAEFSVESSLANLNSVLTEVAAGAYPKAGS